MSRYFFHLGRLYSISTAEILSFFNEEDIKTLNEKLAVVEIEKNFTKHEIQNLLDRIGGTIKISKIFAENIEIPDINEKIQEYLIRNYGNNPKIIFGINIINLNPNSGVFMENILKNLKKDLQKEGFSCRYLNKGTKNIEIPIYFKEKLFSDKGTEINIIKNDNKIYLSESQGVQDIDEYSKRDFSKPFRDPTTGMLPPKLAQIMINLGINSKFKIQNSKFIVDPFCGSGTVLMEAALMGLDSIGSDISSVQSNGAILNMQWIKNYFNLSNISFDVNTKDARNLQIDRKTAKTSVIVTEGYLGPPRKFAPDKTEMDRSNNQILLLYKNFFGRCQELGIPKIVITLPVFRKDREYILLKGFFEMVKKIGYEIQNPFSESFLQKYKFLKLSKRNTLIYDREDQIVGREIVVISNR